jgi:hypothetical protein
MRDLFEPRLREHASAFNPTNDDDDMGWLSLMSDADGPGRHADDVLCMGLIPDDLDEHDADGGDLSWIGMVLDGTGCGHSAAI